MNNDMTVILIFLYLQSDTAKKPYNPVLGETFHCYWDLPSSAANQPPSDTNNIMVRINLIYSWTSLFQPGLGPGKSDWISE